MTVLSHDLDCHIHCLFSVQWFEVRGDCLFCWCWWNCWPSICLNFLFITCSNVAAMIFGWVYNQLPLLLKFVNLKGVHCLDQCVVFTVHCIIDILLVQWNMSKINPFRTNCCVWNYKWHPVTLKHEKHNN